MKPSLGALLRNSHVGVVAIAVLLLWSLDAAFLALSIPVYDMGTFLVQAIAIVDIPYHRDFPGNPYNLMMFGLYGISAAIDFGAAWCLSQCLYRSGPVQCLRVYATRIARRPHV